MWFGNSFLSFSSQERQIIEKKVSSSYLEQCNTRIRILERGKSAIRVGRDKRFLLQDAEIEEFLMIWNAEFFENDGDFPWVGALFFSFQSHQFPRCPDLGTNEAVVHSYLDVAVQLQWLRHFLRRSGGMVE